ncbi:MULTISPECIES: type II toxin-antitoxin system RelE/ParE family toxin [Rhizobium]|uniref:type II toxin-antitoxin system RelE/ParE family toxin n=1 Tax=Rhizobium TaxID=379 RepID=UPI0010308B1F|nr:MULTISPECIES: type II toxin-antitoxin system RelE/ParE family toxin [Rhizobium]QJX08377.1 type II toxin-antitoxin system RelE/ParE family toxin [Rhizobium brockwellii]TAX87503.1 type II toxin-antitoxin system RelE/ParE family toxin [Rhizobium leguminosarum]
MKLIWTAFALLDRDAIFTYIEAENPLAAILVVERIVAAVRRLIDFPASGHRSVVISSPIDVNGVAIERDCFGCQVERHGPQIELPFTGLRVEPLLVVVTQDKSSQRSEKGNRS